MKANIDGDGDVDSTPLSATIQFFLRTWERGAAAFASTRAAGSLVHLAQPTLW